MIHHPAQPFEYASHDSLERALFILQDGIVIINRKAVITYINKSAYEAFEDHLNYQPSIGDSLLDAMGEQDQTRAKQCIDDAFCNRPSVFEAKFLKNGAECWYEIGYYPMPDANGLVTNVCIRAKNITDKILLEKKLETERKAQKNALIKATLDAQERQRSEIGRELHDNVNQVLTTVKLYNEICITEETTNKAMLMKSVQQINFCIETLRALSKKLSSPSIDEIGLKETIGELVDSITQTRKIAVKFYTYNVHNDKISQDLQTTLFRIAQEQLTNVLKYANASSVDVMLVGTPETIALRIQDDGYGFDMSKKRKGVGITNMISRAETLDGKIEIISSPGEGCTLMAEFPLPKNNAAADQ